MPSIRALAITAASCGSSEKTEVVRVRGSDCRSTCGLSIIVTPIDGKGVREEPVYLPGAPVRPARATRIHFEIRMLSVGRVQVVVRDLGFGEFYASSGMVWESEFRI